MSKEKVEKLKNIFATMDRALIAYSGGIDSTLVAKVAYDVLGDKALAITAVSPSLLPEELDEAQYQAQLIGINHEMIITEEMDNPNYTSNPVNRCYFCKSELHDKLRAIALKRGYPYVIDGVNYDDLQDYRPGIEAAKERKVRSPLAEISISKIEVREITKLLNLPWWDKPSQPCLSSRFPYGEEITVDKLHRVGRAEIYLRNLGYLNLRVRSQGDTAKIELLPQEIAKFVNEVDLPTLVNDFQKLGFTYVTLDLEGYRSGKLNQVINKSPSDNLALR
ncbi:ATP-dependent sacrificial sulfur transferase LarE [Cyanobacterium stanieri LEGE 03274]|uniref:ATP-dependent sacrificial sulfur transferase LarE n=1 Tax=Cyanobacterium stanieri LEGE 03274 TaxID=1828756 RepID=A0ABR9V4U6_9CHRO|nr:ATP-dependent sacrificial sulfur transferase LarE [Cyanobacterium stanieri]MBE9222914.1 ATP-dependent sacrificial sulfur transferase LarE [Cyanobacterium stanieri LEGE 03274]